MYERSSAREVFASLALAAGSLGSVSSIESVRVIPVRPIEDPPLLVAYKRDDEGLHLDNNGAMYSTLPLNRRPPKSEPKHPVRRAYGKSGQQKFRNQVDIRTLWWRQ